jgi:Rho-binding antiterminator
MPSPAERNEAYSPVSCDFTDELEFVAVKKIPVKVSHWSETNELENHTGRIKDILTENKEEFLVLNTGERVRLDHIAEIKII